MKPVPPVTTIRFPLKSGSGEVMARCDAFLWIHSKPQAIKCAEWHEIDRSCTDLPSVSRLTRAIHVSEMRKQDVSTRMRPNWQLLPSIAKCSRKEFELGRTATRQQARCSGGWSASITYLGPP
ncbi:unnamed protein product [Chondrus crispus]|uniref:Uncharacterized protein n=1 Tax=Chondrus crispus TaxID=2769 RepID=R7QEJ1_CHOCR|nr:unnamed protein product [Chondrus crispus]CDF36193.1 unnamed protein product [Chondrus crispus]|eukprot:XP_005716012.1 unnamed protein product [Chondrus crispus]